MLTLQIKEKEIENLTPEEEFVRGTVGAKCQINFDEFWQGYEKYIVFKRVGYEPINIMVDSLENEIEIPYTILAEIGEFKIGVFGITETETLPTLYSKDIKILYGTDTHGTTPPTYTPSEIDQLRLLKQDKLVSGTNIKTINNQSILGSGNITIEGGSGSSITIDQTFNPESENAQSGKAVAEAVEPKADTSYVNNTFANALKGSKSGSAILIDDISPVTREMTVKVSSDTVEDLTAVKVSRYGKNLFDFNKVQKATLTTYMNKPCFSYVDGADYFIYTSNFKEDTRYTFTTKAYREDGVINTPISFNFRYTDGTSQLLVLDAGIIGSVTSEAGKTISKISGEFNYGLKCYVDLSVTQLEIGTSASEYEPYIEPTEYTPTADGTVNGVTSLYPNTTLTTDTDGVIIDCEYNRDINKAFAALEAAIATNNS